MSLQDQNYQLREVKLAGGPSSPPSGEHLPLNKVPQKIIPGGVFLLSKADASCLGEHHNLCLKLPATERGFENRYSTLFIEEYLESYQLGIYSVG